MAIERTVPDGTRELLLTNGNTESYVDKIRTRYLGRLLIDFDDLRDLVNLVTSSELIPVKSVRIIFDTGVATEVDDLLALSDAELASGIEIETGSTVIVLEASRAKATGPRWMVWAISAFWARYRRTQALPRYSKQFTSVLVRTFSWLVLVAVVASAVAFNHPGETFNLLSGALAVIALFVPIVMLYIKAKMGSVVFFPGSRQERREDRPIQRRHKFQMTLTIVGSVLIPVFSLVLTILLKK